MARKRPLTEKQRRFVAEYLIDLNAAGAAARAGYSTRGRCASVIGSRMLTDPRIAAAIAQAQAERAERARISADEVLEHLTDIVRAKQTDFTEWGPDGVGLKASDTLTPAQARMVVEVSETVGKYGSSLRIKRESRLQALELIGKHLGMWRERHEVDVNATVESKVSHLTDEELVRRVAQLRASQGHVEEGSA